MDKATEDRIRAKARHDFVVNKAVERAEQAAGELVGREAGKLAKGAHVTIPPPEVVNEINVLPAPVTNNIEAPAVFNNMDLVPLVAMLKEQREADRQLLAQMRDDIAEARKESAEQRELFTQLLQVLAEQKPPRVTVTVPEQPAPIPAPKPKALRFEEDSSGVKRLIPEW